MDRALPILCENCGYDVDSLVARLGAEPELKCPECGRSIAASLPERRTGTSWQRNPTPLTLLSTMWLLFWSPAVTFRRLRADRMGAISLLMTVGATVCFVWPAMWTVSVYDEEPRTLRGAAAFFAHLAPIWTGAFIACLAGVYLLLLWRFRCKRWRLAPGPLLHALAHTMTGLLFGPLLTLPLTLVGIVTLFPRDSLLYKLGVIPAGVGFVLSFLTIPLSFLLPPIVILIAVFVGASSLRFANPPRETAP